MSEPSPANCTAFPAQPTLLTWTESDGITEISSTDNSSLEDGFEVRSYAQDSGYDVIALLPANTTGWRGALAPGGRYAIFAVKDGGPAWQGW